MAYRGIARGNVIEFDKPLPFAEGQHVEVEVGPITSDRSTGAALLRAMHSPPFVAAEDVDELERSIRETRQPPSKPIEFSEEAA